MAEKVHAGAGSHIRDEDQLRYRADQEGRHRGGRLLHALGKAEDTSLALRGNNFLQDGLLGRFHGGDQT